MLLFIIIIVMVAFYIIAPLAEAFALHDKPDSWTKMLITSHDPDKKELCDLSRLSMDEWERSSRINTVTPHTLIMTNKCYPIKAQCR